MRENRFAVSARQWKKWNHLQRHVFERTFVAVDGTYNMYPSGLKVSRKDHKVIAWNAAFLAACAMGQEG